LEAVVDGFVRIIADFLEATVRDFISEGFADELIKSYAYGAPASNRSKERRQVAVVLTTMSAPPTFVQ
jgi:hypothetical protein